jgi:hypothetical protein
LDFDLVGGAGDGKGSACAAAVGSCGKVEARGLGVVAKGFAAEGG